MSKRMLIDANHPEETRVVVLDGSKVEEFDFEAASKRPLKGNIYLAKVTRVEPSLQAAFVEYGGNRQGFLAFSEIHPDYYQIPVADRQALLAEQEAEARRRQEDDIESFEMGSGTKPEGEEDEEDDTAEEAGEDGDDTALVPLDAASIELPGESEPETDAAPRGAAEDAAHGDDDDHADIFVNHDGAAVEHDADEHEDEVPTKSEAAHAAEADYGHDPQVVEAEAAEENEGEIEPVSVSESASDDVASAEAAEENEGAIEPVDGETGETQSDEDQTGEGGEKKLQMQRPPQKWMRRRHYKIQEVIKRRQIILVQVVKEERGNKGAALTTYLSLAGRYCVLMPNTPRGGGISRKITNAADRKRLKSAAQGLELPEGMGLIIRTAGENRTKLEIRRDYEYLMRLWDTIREKTLSSNAPACVYEEGDLIKRVIRDLFTKDVKDLVVEGEAGFRNAKDFMRMLMPAQARNVHQYKDTVPLFQRMHIEQQLDAMFSPTVTLKSGGYIVINQTEALVSIDVNSGRATREHSIEETARKTNLEAADEVGRQLRLRDLAGLIVIDFIDMEESRNDREVEKRLRDAVKNDRARVQIGKISQFGLMEMSRQRLRAGVVASSTVICPHCGGAGIIRSVESTALRVLRALEEEGEKNRASAVTVKVANDVAIYTLNQKRRELARIEAEYGMEVSFEPKEGLMAGHFELDRIRTRDPEDRPRSHAVSIEAGFVPSDEPEDDVVEVEGEEEVEETEDVATADEESHQAPQQPREGEGKRRRRRRGGRGRNRDRRPEGADVAAPASDAEGVAVEAGNADQAAGDEDQHGHDDNGHANGGEGQNGEGSGRRRRRRRGRRGGRARDDAQPSAPSFGSDADRFGTPDEIDTTPTSTPVHAPGAPSTPVWSLQDDIPDTTPKEEAPKPAKKGWWQRAFSGDK
ncbi:MAG: Rne/Rng family ribonuclease [Alphaproteobacteria bacterium]|nr:Rne/Rng family ribonuclease [Alphaproteobacteria bacterium]